MAKELPTATEKLELHNLVTLATRARDKQKAGKPLTRAEIAAVGELETRQQAKAVPPAAAINPGDVVKMIVALEPTKCDEAAIRKVLGDAATKSLPEIAAAFGVTHSTVKHTWRANGMPGDGKRRQFPWADVLIWYLARNTRNEEARGVDEYTQRKRDAETRAAEADALIKERKAEVVVGRYIKMEIPIAVVSSEANRLRDKLMSIDREIKPLLAPKYAAKCIEHIKRYISNALTSFSESSLNRLGDAYEGSNDDVRS